MSNNENETRSPNKHGYVERFFRVTPTKNTAFVSKLFEMVNDEKTVELISWNGSGDQFTIYNNIEFSSQVLPRYFKHCNWSSFVRQLNMYDFHKINDTVLDSDESSNRENQQRWDFKHDWFTRQGHDRLHRIRRKTTKTKSSGIPESPEPIDNDPQESGSMQPIMDASIPLLSYECKMLKTANSVHSFQELSDHPNRNSLQNNSDSPIQDAVAQLTYTIENMQFKLEATSKEVLYLRQTNAKQQNMLNELLVSVDSLKSKLYGDTQETRKPKKIHELLGTSNDMQIDEDIDFSYNSNIKRRKT
ncbi:unnamed protein product [Rhizopus stolonifer]